MVIAVDNKLPDEVMRQIAMDYLKPPFNYMYGYIFDSLHHKVADDMQPLNNVVQIRGWGAISYLECPEQLQDMIGHLVAEALTKFWNESTAERKFVDLRQIVSDV